MTRALHAIERTRCRSCGAPFNRKRSEHWKTLCLSCWRWHRACGLYLLLPDVIERWVEVDLVVGGRF